MASFGKKRLNFKNPPQEIEVVKDLTSDNEEIIHSDGELEADEIPLTQIDPHINIPRPVVADQKKEEVVMEPKSASRKRKTTSKTSPILKKKKNVEDIIMEQQGPDESGWMSILAFLMVVWTEEILLNLITIIKKTQMEALRERQLPAKRTLFTMQQGVSYVLNELKRQKIELENCSLTDFVDVLQESPSYTTFTERSIPEEVSNWILEKFITNLPGPSCSSSSIPTTGTLSTTVHTPTAAAGVPFRASLNHQVDQVNFSAKDTLDELFPISTCQSNIGLISQSIARKQNDVVTTWSSPGESGYRVVKLDIYEYGKICNVPKDQWWKQATLRSTFLTSSNVDPKESMIQKLLGQVAADLKKVPNLRKEERVMRSSNFFKSDQHRQ